jgi:aspartyl-tRNA(Asn)/glutamyl-tRNA(Gln) amidotransferase subunit A
MRSIEELATDLAAGKTTSRALVDEALARARNPEGEGARSFTKLYDDEAREAAEGQDRLRRAGYVASPLAGIPISIKDLFDVAGETTLAGSKALDDAPPATRDAPIVARLKAAGAVIVGKTNMTEFAFSGVGINPHYGTPGNPADRARIPGGSSSGAAVSVGDGCAVVAIGTDTGGSVRIPAAFCGLVGFKPTQYRVSRDGAVPLSTTLDSIGPLARSVADCALVDAIMSGKAAGVPEPISVAGLRLGIPKTVVLDDLDKAVATRFEKAVATLAAAGARVSKLPLEILADIPKATAKGGFASSEAYFWHARLLDRRGGDYDPRVRQRILRGREMSAADYLHVLAERERIIAAVAAETRGIDALLMPTVPFVAPPIAAFADDAEFARLNMLILRNPSLINFLDRCAVTLPVERVGELPVGLSLIGAHGGDKRLLALALGAEAALAAIRSA